MSDLSYEDAFEVASLLRSRADDLETRAIEFDKWQGEKSGYTAASQAWAKEVQQKWRNSAVAYRAFARDLLTRASNREC